MKTFNYSDENDRCYGLTGMVLTMYEHEAINMLQRITLDCDDGYSIAFTPDFYFNSNPRYSAKLAWNEMLRQYQSLVRLVLGNIACRRLVGEHKPIDAASRAEMLRLVSEPGADDCALEQDEIETIFNHTLRDMQDMFGNAKVAMLSDRFAQELKQRRTMASDEVAELIQFLIRH